jgi:hypothetical protein
MANGHGGARSGAGRKAGGLNGKTSDGRTFAQQARDEGVSPLEVMLRAMREAYASGNLREAADFAKMAAPYCHPKLESVEVGGSPERPVWVQFIEVDRAAERNGDGD